MRISSKGRLALEACLVLTDAYMKDERMSVLKVADHLKSSKVYMEQIFTLLKKSDTVISVKGSGGGYYLSKEPEQLLIYDILKPIESGVFEEITFSQEGRQSGEEMSKKDIFSALDTCLYQKIDEEMKRLLLSISLKDIYDRYLEEKDDGYMFYI